MGNATYTVDEALNLAAQHHGRGELDQAEAIYRQILQVAPDHVNTLHNMGELYCRRRNFEVAIQYLNRALALEPNSPTNINTMAVALMSTGQPGKAYEYCLRAIELSPDFSNAHSNLGICHADRGEMDLAIAEFRKAIELDPNNACAHDGLGLSLLMVGELQNGWHEQEWRWRKHDFAANRYPNANHWRGEDIAGKTLMLYVEQGFGDVIQFCRYIPLLAQRGTRVLMEDVADLSGLLRRSLPGLAEFFPVNEPPAYDLACPLMSVPLWYGTEVPTIPAQQSYLKPDPVLVEQWRMVFQTDPALKVGIAWAGRPTHANDQNRSTALATFAALAPIPGVTFYSLQKGPPSAQAGSPPVGMRLIDLSSRLNNFDDTAAVIAHLDLVISVDTVLVHLAGALGKPVWTLVPFCPDWRWLLNRTDTPWYPTMRLFRLPKRGDWGAVMGEVGVALRGMRGKF